MMTLLLPYAYCVGIISSRKIERDCYEDMAFQVLTAKQQPDHSRISEFHRRNLDALKSLFVQILRLCQQTVRHSYGLSSPRCPLADRQRGAGFCQLGHDG